MSWAGSGGISRAGARFGRGPFARGAAGAFVSRFARGTARARGAVAVGPASAMDVTPFRGAGDSITRPRTSADAVEPVRPPLGHELEPPQGPLVELGHRPLARSLDDEVHAVFRQEIPGVGAESIDPPHVLVPCP